MLFWIIAAVLTFVAVLSVLLPVLVSRQQDTNLIAYDKEIYKSRLVEISKDLDLGRISSEEAEAAKAEEGRRLLSLSSRVSAASDSKSGSGIARNLIVGASILFVPVFSLGSYFSHGSPQFGDMPLASRESPVPSDQSIEQLVARVESELSKNPDDLRGWRAIAPVYLRAARFEDAETALRNILRLGGPDAEIQATLGEILTTLEGGVIKQEALQLFRQANELAPEKNQPRFYLALAMSQEGKYAEAVMAWRALLSNAPADAQWPAIARARLSEAEANLGSSDSVSSDETRGPTNEQVDAARRMSGKDRMAMIAGMVESLSERLKEDPNNEQGWRQLIRSYIVLGKAEKAKEAVLLAKQALVANESFAAEMDELMQNLNSGGGN